MAISPTRLMGKKICKLNKIHLCSPKAELTPSQKMFPDLFLFTPYYFIHTRTFIKAATFA